MLSVFTGKEWEKQILIRFYRALNAWALNRKRLVAKKVPVLLNKFFEDMETPLGILDALDKYNRKGISMKIPQVVNK